MRRRFIVADIETGIATGAWHTDTVWFRDADTAQRALLTLDRARDALGETDGFIVLAPGWAACTDCTHAPAHRTS